MLPPLLYALRSGRYLPSLFQLIPSHTHKPKHNLCCFLTFPAFAWISSVRSCPLVLWISQEEVPVQTFQRRPPHESCKFVTHINYFISYRVPTTHFWMFLCLVSQKSRGGSTTPLLMTSMMQNLRLVSCFLDHKSLMRTTLWVLARPAYGISSSRYNPMSVLSFLSKSKYISCLHINITCFTVKKLQTIYCNSARYFLHLQLQYSQLHAEFLICFYICNLTSPSHALFVHHYHCVYGGN